MRAHLKVLIAVLAVSLAGTAEAQGGRGGDGSRERPREDRPPRGRPPEERPPEQRPVGVKSGTPAGPVAGIAPPPVVIVPGNSRFHAPPGSYITRIPVVVFPDGRVFAQFGHGFEQVVRGCPGGTAITSSVLPAPAQPTVVQPTVIQPPAVVTQPMPYNPPVAGKQVVAQPLDWTTASQMLAGQTFIVNQTACWAVNGYGQVFVFSP